MVIEEMKTAKSWRRGKKKSRRFMRDGRRGGGEAERETE